VLVVVVVVVVAAAAAVTVMFETTSTRELTFTARMCLDLFVEVTGS
jgi:type II secretory pathway pseudopilin PulG